MKSTNTIKEACGAIYEKSYASKTLGLYYAYTSVNKIYHLNSKCPKLRTNTPECLRHVRRIQASTICMLCITTVDISSIKQSFIKEQYAATLVEIIANCLTCKRYSYAYNKAFDPENDLTVLEDGLIFGSMPLLANVMHKLQALGSSEAAWYELAKVAYTAAKKYQAKVESTVNNKDKEYLYKTLQLRQQLKANNLPLKRNFSTNRVDYGPEFSAEEELLGEKLATGFHYSLEKIFESWCVKCILQGDFSAAKKEAHDSFSSRWRGNVENLPDKLELDSAAYSTVREWLHAEWLLQANKLIEKIVNYWEKSIPKDYEKSEKVLLGIEYFDKIATDFYSQAILKTYLSYKDETKRVALLLMPKIAVKDLLFLKEKQGGGKYHILEENIYNTASIKKSALETTLSLLDLNSKGPFSDFKNTWLAAKSLL